MIREHPCELLWYGESLLLYRPFAIIPVEALFKVYHFQQQYAEGCRLGENHRVLAANFFDVVNQSNWDWAAAASRHRRFLSALWRGRP